MTPPCSPQRLSLRWLLAAEAVFPVAAVQSYMWSVSHDRPRWLDLLVGVAILALTIAYTLRRRMVGWRTFGLAHLGDHRRAAGPVAVFTVAAVGALLLSGVLTAGRPGGGLRYEWDVVRALAAYPLWGLVQQGILFGVIYPRLQLLAGPRLAALFTAGLFAVAHLPNPLLVAGGFVMVLFYAWVWQRSPSLPAIGISHGLIGAVCDKALHVSMRVGAHYFTG